MKFLIQCYDQPLIQWVLKTFFYLAIILGLIIIYGFAAAHTGTFIYNEF
ncbi:teichoic acid D-Ala incorporation-associated protein DltX [Sporolactobacillus pectinivorans]|nr:teichoic acid D-Ala incorporation-associated protein DltX [Sporolactobacillus pectinivorans]